MHDGQHKCTREIQAWFLFVLILVMHSWNWVNGLSSEIYFRVSNRPIVMT